MKSHRSGNVCNGILCSSGLWTGFQRRNSRGIMPTFLLALHPSSRCRADRRCKAKTKRSEPFGSSLALNHAVGLSPSRGPGSFGWAHAKTIFSKAECVWSTEVHHWGVPGMGWWPELSIHLWAQRGSAASDISLIPSSWAGQDWCSWLCAHQLSLWNNLSAWESSRN